MTNAAKHNSGVIKAIRKTAYVLYVFLVAFITLELILRIYNPFYFRVKDGHLMLPVNERLVIHNTINPKLDPVIVNTRNALGFRGPERPAPFHKYLSIVTVGSSTTECHFLSDNRTWPWLMGQALKRRYPDIWVNNAGLDGHSTFGHQVLLNDYLVKLRPRMLLFLTGIGDVENDGPTFHDKQNTRGAYNDFRHFVFNNSEALNLCLNLVQRRKAMQLNNTMEGWFDLRKAGTLLMSDTQMAARKRAQAPYLAGYRQRIVDIIDTCRRYGILPVFMTQPDLFGAGRDSLTGIDLETVKVAEDLNGKGLWELLQLYNAQLKETCESKKVTVIDLAAQLPKNSLYFYDASHFTNQGAEKVAALVTAGLQPIVDSVYKNCFR